MDAAPRPCPRCGHPAARLKRMDNYLSLFFIPVIPVKRGEQFLDCPRCGPVEDTISQAWHSAQADETPRCVSCKRPLEEGFSFCPYCGTRQ
jgi:predicted RNA-binding Zn-ribbon protein involved in translation (DUF1610 family)